MTNDQLENIWNDLEQAKKAGDLDTQIEITQNLLSVAQQRADGPAELEMLRQLGNLYQEKGDLRKAHSYRVIAAELAAQSADHLSPSLRAHIENDLGRSFLEAKDWNRAAIHLQHSLKLIEEEPNENVRRLNRAIIQVNYTLVLANQDKLPDALKLAESIEKDAEELQDHYLLAILHGNLASYYLQTGRINESQRHARQAQVHAGFTNHPGLQAFAGNILGRSFFFARFITGNRQYTAEAEQRLYETVSTAQSQGNIILEAEAEYDLAILCEQLGQWDKAIKHFQRVFDLMEQVRVRIGYEEFQLTFFQSFESTYNRAIEFLLRQKQLDMAFLVSERLRSRILLAALGSGRSNVQKWGLEKQDLLYSVLNNYGKQVLFRAFGEKFTAAEPSLELTVGISNLSRRGGNHTSIDYETSELQQARQDFLELYETQRSYRTEWSQRQSPDVINMEVAQTLLDEDEALLSYIVTDDSLVIFAADRERHGFQHLNYPADRLANDVSKLCTAMISLQEKVLDPFIAERWFRREPTTPWPKEIANEMKEVQQYLKKLYAILIAPLLPLIATKKHWIVVPHGPLHRVPWSALHDGNEYLVQNHSISLLPSMSIGQALVSEPNRTSGQILSFADPDPENPVLQLPAAQIEAQVITRVFPNAQPPFVGISANKVNFLAYAPNAKLLHLACHHCFDASAPLLSFLKLAGESGAEFLYAFEIAELALSAELVCLSACESGRSKIATGDEQYGIVRSFLNAGAQSVVSTLWNIQDQSAAVFFSNFYRLGCISSLAQALAGAQCSMIESPKYLLPCFWAPYILSGEWNSQLTP